MKLSAVVFAACVAVAAAVSGKGKPGYCADSTACAAQYTCVSVQTTRAAVTDVKQCLPMSGNNTVCTGTAPGLCPSFSTTWGTAFREISSVCSYISPDTGTKCEPAGTNSTGIKGAINCMFVQDPTNDTATIGVIYGCVDYDGSRLLFDKNSASDKLASKFNYSAIISANCVNPKNPSGSNFVCSSQGTCAPNSAASMDYSCKCNVGFSGTYCEKILNNKCYNDGVCGGGSCDLTKMECTDCPAGTLGDKCAQCDPTYDSTKVCGGHGKCVASSGTSTLGADSSSSSDGSSDAASASATVGPAKEATTAPSTKKTDSSSDGSSSAASETVRFLTAMASTYQCECDTGYSDVHCGVKLTTTKAPSSTTAAPTTSSSAVSLTASIVGVALSLAAASLSA